MHNVLKLKQRTNSISRMSKHRHRHRRRQPAHLLRVPRTKKDSAHQKIRHILSLFVSNIHTEEVKLHSRL